MGEAILGDSEGERSGKSVALSDDGDTVVVASFPSSFQAAGHVKVYHLNGNTWTQKGQILDGDTIGDNFGGDISLSSDGSIISRIFFYQF